MWAQHKSNGWILGELVIVMCALWFTMDRLQVGVCCYNALMGYDISNTWRFKLSTPSSNAPGCVPDLLYDSSTTQGLLKLVEHIHQEQEVEEVRVMYRSIPYSDGSSWGALLPLGVDTSEAVGQNYHKLKVPPSYFDVFRMKDREGRAITPLVKNAYRPFVTTAEVEDLSFGEQSAIGRQISGNDDLSELFTITTILPTFRSNDFDCSENYVFTILKGESLQEFVKNFGVRSAELSVRTKCLMTEDKMYAFLGKTADWVTVGNTSVHGVTLLTDQRDDQLRFTRNENSEKLSMITSLLVSVFFGIIGTFWLRIEWRRSEISLRVAIDSSRGRLGEYMYLEGLGFLAVAVPILLVFVFSMAFSDKLDSYREPLSVLRFLVTLSVSCLLIVGMTCVGIWFPVRKAVKMTPAEVLHYEQIIYLRVCQFINKKGTGV